MVLDARDILEAVESHAAASGYFTKVNRHEPKSAPGAGLTASIWVNDLSPVARASGMAATTVRLELTVQVRLSMLQEPQDDIDVQGLTAVDALCRAYSQDFTLDGMIRNVDLLGAHGPGLRVRAGHINQDGKTFRVYVITLPVIVNDLWTQAP